MNELQRLFKARGISMRQLADMLGLDMHSVQKTVKGVRQTPQVQEAIASFMGLPVDQCFGPTAARNLRPLIEREINKKRGEYENKLKAKFLDSHRVSARRKVVNG